MKRINVSYFVTLDSNLERVGLLPEKTPFIDIAVAVFSLRKYLEPLVKNADPVAIQSSMPEARELLEVLEKIEKKKEGSPTSYDTSDSSLNQLRWKAHDFRAALSRELRDLETYFVSPVGIYSTPALLNRPEAMFFDNAKDLPPETLVEIQEAAKCLAFSLSTASAFHQMRAVESVLRRYYDKLSNGATRPTRSAMGIYLDEILKLPGVDADLHAALKQIKTLYRDPVAHPEVFLSVPEAVSLLGVVQSAINRMLTLIKPAHP